MQLFYLEMSCALSCGLCAFVWSFCFGLKPHTVINAFNKLVGFLMIECDRTVTFCLMVFDSGKKPTKRQKHLTFKSVPF